VRASAKTVRNVSLVGKVGLEDVCRVGLDAVEDAAPTAPPGYTYVCSVVIQ